MEAFFAKALGTLRPADEKWLWSRAVPEPNSGCWLWIGATFTSGYGKITRHGKHLKAPRVVWELFHETIPDGLFVCHRCDIPRCVNPDHLFLGTPADNSQDAVMKGRTARGERNANAKLIGDDVVAIRLDPRTATEIARAYNVSDVLIHKIKNRQVWNHLPGKIVPARHDRKLTPSDVLAIRHDQRRQIDIAGDYGISQVMVSRIKLRKAWKQING